MAQDLTLTLLEEVIDAFNAHDADKVGSFFAEDGVMLLAAGPEPVGKTLKGPKAIKATLQKRFEDAPNIQWTEGKNWITGNKALSEWRVRGTTNAGADIDIIGCDLWEFQDGKIKVKDTYYKQPA
jgi:ketosteroid isomerase-like protein|tara:strand:- start:1499 stop:1873 length:375 start_codon:yes stop_codon:yes gene_type:complete